MRSVNELRERNTRIIFHSELETRCFGASIRSRGKFEREREILDILEILELLDSWWINLRASLPEISFVFATLIDLKFTNMIILEFVMMNIHLFLIFNFLRVIEFVNIYPDIKGK